MTMLRIRLNLRTIEEPRYPLSARIGIDKHVKTVFFRPHIIRAVVAQW